MCVCVSWGSVYERGECELSVCVRAESQINER